MLTNKEVAEYALMYYSLPSMPYQNSSFGWEFKTMPWEVEEVEKGPEVPGATEYRAWLNVYYPYSSLFGPRHEKINIVADLKRHVYTHEDSTVEVLYIGFDQRGGKIFVYREVSNG